MGTKERRERGPLAVIRPDDIASGRYREVPLEGLFRQLGLPVFVTYREREAVFVSYQWAAALAEQLPEVGTQLQLDLLATDVTWSRFVTMLYSSTQADAAETVAAMMTVGRLQGWDALRKYQVDSIERSRSRSEREA